MTIRPLPTRSRLAAAAGAATVALAAAVALAGEAHASGQAPGPGLQGADLVSGDPAPVVVYLVRHAERAEDGTDDPPLALAGQIRTQVLRRLLAQAGVTHVHATGWRRTRETARPVAEDMGLDLSVYDPDELEAFAETLSATPGHHLVVGHSNTTPTLVKALGGMSSEPIDDLEYDRLYIVVIPPDDKPVTTLLRFGEPYVAGQDFGLRAGLPRRPGGPSS